MLFSTLNRKPFWIQTQIIGWVTPDEESLLIKAGWINQNNELHLKVNQSEAIQQHLTYLGEFLQKDSPHSSQLTDPSHPVSVFPYKSVFSNDLNAFGYLPRYAARSLGVTTHSVRLFGRTPVNGWWICQRAAHRRINPNQWDCIVSGMLHHNETPIQGLARETFEEIRYHLPITSSNITSLTPIYFAKEVEDGFLSEWVYGYEMMFPDTFRPIPEVNEIQHIKTAHTNTVLKYIQNGEFCYESGKLYQQHYEMQ